MSDFHDDTFKGRDTPYFGMAMIAAIIGGLGFLTGLSFLYWPGGLFLGGGALGYLLSKYKKVKFLPEGIHFSRGQLGIKKMLPFETIEAIHLKREREDSGQELMTLDLDSVEDWKTRKYISITVSNKKSPVSVSHNEFATPEFERMVRSLQLAYLEAKGSPLQKANRVYQKTLNYIHDDRRMLSELQLSLQDAYRSVFRPFETLYKKETVEELDRDSEVLFHTIKQGNVLVYFKKGAYLSNIKQTSVDSAKNLISAAENNLEIVKTRLASHQEIKQKLERVRSQLKSRERLNNVANKLDKLQQQNINKSLEREDVEHEAEVLEQIELLTENIHNTETLEKSLVLKEHIELFRENVQGEEIMLKELNKKLK